jgi:hypothetical protein
MKSGADAPDDGEPRRARHDSVRGAAMKSGAEAPDDRLSRGLILVDPECSHARADGTAPYRLQVVNEPVAEYPAHGWCERSLGEVSFGTARNVQNIDRGPFRPDLDGVGDGDVVVARPEAGGSSKLGDAEGGECVGSQRWPVAPWLRSDSPTARCTLRRRGTLRPANPPGPARHHAYRQHHQDVYGGPHAAPR